MRGISTPTCFLSSFFQPFPLFYKQANTTPITFCKRLCHGPKHFNIYINAEGNFVCFHFATRIHMLCFHICFQNFFLCDLLFSNRQVSCTTMSPFRSPPICRHAFSSFFSQVLECFFPSGLGIHLSLLRGRNSFIIPKYRTLGTHRYENYVVSYRKVFPGCQLCLVVLCNRD